MEYVETALLTEPLTAVSCVFFSLLMFHLENTV